MKSYVFKEGAGETVKYGKPKWPSFLTVQFEDKQHALDAAEKLVRQARLWADDEKITITIAGDIEEYDD